MYYYVLIICIFRMPQLPFSSFSLQQSALAENNTPCALPTTGSFGFPFASLLLNYSNAMCNNNFGKVDATES